MDKTIVIMFINLGLYIVGLFAAHYAGYYKGRRIESERAGRLVRRLAWRTSRAVREFTRGMAAGLDPDEPGQPKGNNSSSDRITH